MATQDEIGSGSPLRIALAGIGTVGTGVLRLLQENREIVEARAGRGLQIVAVSARNRGKDRGVDLSGYDWHDDMVEMARRDDVDAVVELVGGADGPSLTLARATLQAGKALVTANKAMIAHHGMALAEMAAAGRASLKFEAAVAGGIPVVKGLREGAAANAIERIYGILNGTSNYILSAMEDTGAGFADTLVQAQELGYAESDPTFDIEGVDAAHKLAILAAIAFGCKIDFSAVKTHGISEIRAADIRQADALGFVIRLIGLADTEIQAGQCKLMQRVQPCLVSKDHPLASVDGPTNAVVTEGNYSGRLLFQGAGAGDGPTASAVVADLIDLGRGERSAPFSVPVGDLATMPPADTSARMGRTYLRFMVTDKPGVLAEITAAMRDADLSIESLIQEGRAHEGSEVLVSMVTHEGPEGSVDKALALLADSPNLTAAPLVMPILRN